MRSNHSAKKLRLERLEDKRPLAADFAVSVVDGDLFITADSTPTFSNTLGIFVDPDGDPDALLLESDDEISFNTISDGELMVIPGGAPIDIATTFGAVTGDIFVDLGDAIGDGGFGRVDFLVVNAALPGDLTVTGSNTINSVTLRALDVGSTIAGDLNVVFTGGLGNLDINNSEVQGDVLYDTSAAGATEPGLGVPGFDAQDAVIAGELVINLNADDESVTVRDSTVGDRIHIDAGDGDNEVSFDRSVVSGGDIDSDIIIVTGSGSDVIGLFDVQTGDDVRIDAGVGEDEVTLFAVTAPDDVRIDTGADDDTVEILSSINDPEFTGVSTGDDVVINLGDGDDTLTIEEVTSSGEGPVSAAVGGDLRIRGGAGGDVIDVLAAAVDGETTIGAGDGDDLIFLGDGSSFTGAVSLRGGQGDDDIATSLIETTGYIELVGGADNDILVIDNSIIGAHAFVFAGGGMNEVELSVSEIGGSAWVFTGNSDDEVFADEVSVGDDLRIFTGGGADMLALSDINVADLLLVDMGAGDDELLIEEAELNRVFVDLGRGDDSLTLDTVSADGFALFNGGRGTDDLTVTGMNDFDAAFAVWFEDIDIS